ncbi:hypothetical protein QYE76_025776 [Lolium multiflorum]|uniref:DUF3615 domain-containing protein n=1 Tax=Lolium multiflorum TaxID=4521 RepID=A0AAD8RHG2_LOLMU|nr:hypothetical protein QYE76_025776 [Lolium multiflorum]
MDDMDTDAPEGGVGAARPEESVVADTTAAPAALDESTSRLAPALQPRPAAVAAAPRKRTPGRWRRIPRPERTEEYLWHPRDHSPCVKAMMDECDLITLKNIEQIENMREEDCDLFTEQDRLDFHAFKKKMIPALRGIVDSKPENTFFTYTKFSDTPEEHLTAEGMEAQILARLPERQPCKQAKDFAELALAHYNENSTCEFKLTTTLLSNCFSESSGTTYGHVNFTAVPQEETVVQPTTSEAKRLFFAELMLTSRLQGYANANHMRVLRVCTIDDDSCYGGCHEIFRKIDHKMRDDMDYERCHACSDRIKHPNGQLFNGGHNSTRMPYYSAL